MYEYMRSLLRNWSICFLTVIVFSTPGSVFANGWKLLGIEGQEVGKVTVHPDTPETIFLTTGMSIYRSTDAGLSFDNVFVNPRGYNFSDLNISPRNPNVILAADVGNVFEQNAHVHFSRDGGDTWHEFPFSYWKIQDVEPDPVIVTNFFVVTDYGLYRRAQLIEENGGADFAICPLDNQFLFLGVGDTLGIGISTNGGINWSYHNQGLPVHASTRIRTIALHPKDPSRLLIGLQTSLNPITYDVCVSQDSGCTYTSTGWDFNAPRDAVVDPTVGAAGFFFVASNQGVHGLNLENMIWRDFNPGLEGAAIDVNGLASLNGETLYAGTRSGIWKFDHRPLLSMTARAIDDSQGGNGSGSAEPGEQIALSVYLCNTQFEAKDISAVLVTADTNIVIDHSEVSFPNIQPFSAETNDADPFLISIRADAEYGHTARLWLGLTSNAGSYVDTLSFEIEVGGHLFLIVDDDEGANYEKYYTATFDTLDLLLPSNVLYDRWDVNDHGPVIELLQSPNTYNPVVWYTGEAEQGTLTEIDRNSLAGFLQRGGRLLLTGQNIAEDLDGSYFLKNLLGIGWIKNIPDAICHGLPGDPLSGNMDDIVTQGLYGANNQTSRDKLKIVLPDVSSVSIVYDTTTLDPAGVRIEKGMARCIFLGFGFEAVNRPGGNPDFISRVEMMREMVNWLTSPDIFTELIPDDDPTIVPRGGSFGMTAHLTNRLTHPTTTDVWLGAYSDTTWFQRRLYPNVSLDGGETLQAHFNQFVPVGTPVGEYSYVEFCGDFESWTVTDSSFFSFTVTELSTISESEQ